MSNIKLAPNIVPCDTPDLTGEQLSAVRIINDFTLRTIGGEVLKLGLTVVSPTSSFANVLFANF